jgi:eukaryotic-like serine/threonine-protein kinase
VATQELGKYEILKRLATGGMADLWLARAQGIEGFERHVVIKRIRAEREGEPRMVEMFLAEARLAAKLHHNNIVQVHDVGIEDGKPYFAMEYVHGVDVRQLLEVVHRRREMIPIDHVVTIGTSIASALHHTHERIGADRTPLGIVHRDITPGNVLIAFDGTVKVADFGIAKVAIHGVETEPGVRKGKVPYMSPEQCVGAPIDRRSDVFGLGILLYELTTARRLFKGGNDYKTMTAVVRGEIPIPSLHRADLPPALEAIILRALERDRDRRYPSARALAEALDGFATEHRLRTSQASISPRTSASCSVSDPSRGSASPSTPRSTSTGPAMALPRSTTSSRFRSRSNPPSCESAIGRTS